MIAAGIDGVVGDHVGAGNIHVDHVTAHRGGHQGGVAGITDGGAQFAVAVDVTFQGQRSGAVERDDRRDGVADVNRAEDGVGAVAAGVGHVISDSVITHRVNVYGA